MGPRKAELRKIVLDILFRRETVGYEPSQFANLVIGVAEVLERHAGSKATSQKLFPHSPQLESTDRLLVQEIFWDLVVERIITIGLNVSNPDFPWFRLHSEAQSNLSSRKAKARN
jgi:hypothetical protein